MADSKNAGEILRAVVEDGREELDWAPLGLTFSGFAAGLNISFSAVALAVVGALTGGVGLAAYLAYPLGFLIVILGKAQLYTENTVTPVAVALTDPRTVPNMLRLWAVVFVANIIGALLFSAVVVYGHILEPGALRILFEEVAHKAEYGFGTVFLKAIFGGWLVALIAWLVAASQDTISRVFFVFSIAFLIPAAGLTHCIAGSTEFLISVFSGKQTWGVPRRVPVAHHPRQYRRRGYPGGAFELRAGYGLQGQDRPLEGHGPGGLGQEPGPHKRGRRAGGPHRQPTSWNPLGTKFGGLPFHTLR